ncbi:S-adenosylmethionine uptake transporter [Pararhizobium capsulatum DSM 1112]|uniref:S-adenosylmethionine uptake transporter n=1 Tax=Pararhizobium capsulatum DSM 1112 TaxID=1121113 RepID=A0ABU0C040_9HYPH|nr:DMT family transporter [Pararhizobium capsulatum]MDQ0322462.1 S-adenosylmethionine uptake transporter [Pararhizobium capsulatum DSM 1112]
MPAEASALPIGAMPPRSNVKAALIVLCSFAVFSGTDALVKLLSGHFPVPQVTFMVTVAALVFVIGSAVVSGRGRALWPRHPGLAFVRAALLAGDTLLIYYAFAALPLAEAYVLAFLSPVLVAVLAFAFLGERMSRLGWIGVLLGFAGVIVALQPGVTPMNFGHAAAIGSALLFAFSLVLLRRTKATESDTALVASLLVVLSVLSLAVALAGEGFKPVVSTDIAIVAAAGLLLFGGHALLVRAFRLGDASVVAPFQYSQIVWGCLYGALLFGAPIEIHTLAGAVIIILSGWLVLK